jgi:PhzF family phenazine biosynthesis protein
MKLPIYQVDAFTSKAFGGNPAAVCPLEGWIDDRLMQSIAAENNLAETAFFVPEGDGYRIRWFTPAAEVALCGHATLASAYVIFRRLHQGRDTITFQSKSGPLRVAKNGDRIALDFPANPPVRCEPPPELVRSLGVAPLETLVADTYLCVFGSEAEVRALKPDMRGLASLDRHAVIVTAPGSDVDFVSRFFAPQVGIDEDPVTGSSHCTLVPYWSARLGKTTLRARQVSPRGGELLCELLGDRVIMEGDAAPYLEGTIEV